MTSPVKKSARTALQGVRSIAVVGVSTKTTKFGTSAFRELRKHGFEVYPVHPSMDRIDDVKCYGSVADLPLTPDCVLVSVKPKSAGDVVSQAAAKGVRRIWFQLGADFSAAANQARQAGLDVVSGRCILMYAEPVTGIHRLHRFFSKLFGKY
jgi:predicted CoA-binding protein